MSRRLLVWLILAAAVGLSGFAVAQPARNNPTPPARGSSPNSGDVELVERLLAARREYQVSLEALRVHYYSVGDVERTKWAEEELRHFHRIKKHPYRLDLDVPPPTLQASMNIPEANDLYRKAMSYKGHGFGSDGQDNQIRAELLLQQLLTSYPQSDKIGDAAYQLGDIYEGKHYEMYRRAASPILSLWG